MKRCKLKKVDIYFQDHIMQRHYETLRKSCVPKKLAVKKTIKAFKEYDEG